jgi:molybdate transport system substrate-binding protein
MKLRWLALGALLLLQGCQSADVPARPQFLIAAAADLRFALEELARMFQRAHPEVEVKTVYGSSGQFVSQILAGAPYDVFCSADIAYPRRLVEEGLALPGSEFIYAVGRIVLWAPRSSPLDVAAGVAVLRDPRVRYIAVANPQHAPYGAAAVAALRSLGVYDAAAPKFVFGENVSQTLQFVQSGSADLGIVALSLALADPVRETGKYWEFPLDSYPRMEQGGVILKSTRHPELAAEFRRMLTRAEARQTLKRYGFALP